MLSRQPFHGGFKVSPAVWVIEDNLNLYNRIVRITPRDYHPFDCFPKPIYGKPSLCYVRKRFWRQQPGDTTPQQAPHRMSLESPHTISAPPCETITFAFRSQTISHCTFRSRTKLSTFAWLDLEILENKLRKIKAEEKSKITDHALWNHRVWGGRSEERPEKGFPSISSWGGGIISHREKYYQHTSRHEREVSQDRLQRFFLLLSLLFVDMPEILMAH